MAAAKPVPRGFFNGLVDRLAGWSSNLSAERSSYTILPVRIPMDDDDQEDGGGGVFLAADVYQPTFPASKNKHNAQTQRPLGTIVAIGPYGRRFPLTLALARLWAARGYVVLFVSSRGTFGSSGVFEPCVDEERDCPRVIRWMRKQEWYTGRFATIGMSYLGYTQWAIMAASYEALGLDKDLLEKEHAAAIMLVGPHDFSNLVWGTGSLWLPIVDWAAMTQDADKVGMLRAMYAMISVANTPDGDVKTKKMVPLLEGVEKKFGRGKGDNDGGNPTLDWLKKHVQTSKEKATGETATAYWKRMNQSRALDTTRAPILLVGGWQDLFIQSTMEQWRRLDERGVTVGLTLGGWNHMEAGNDSYEWLDWLDTHLAQKPDVKPRPARVRVQVMSTGANTTNEWKWFENWPPANTQPVQFQFAADSQLLFAEGLSQTQTQTDTASFTFDPHDPTHAPGGDLLFGGGYVNDSSLALRSDVLSFTTPPLDKAIEIHGTPRIELLHSSDNPHVDLFIRLSAVEYQSGKAVSRNVCQVYRRLDPERVAPGQTTKIVLELSGCAHRFSKGTSIRVLVAGGNFPHYAFNLGSGEPQGTGTTLRPAKHTVHLGGSEGSMLVLPVLSDE